jgi:hypothetical protein
MWMYRTNAAREAFEEFAESVGEAAAEISRET